MTTHLPNSIETSENDEVTAANSSKELDAGALFVLKSRGNTKTH